MDENCIRQCVIDLVLWTDTDKLLTIWSFVKNYLKDERVGIHSDDEYIIERAEFLKAQRPQDSALLKEVGA